MAAVTQAPIIQTHFTQNDHDAPPIHEAPPTHDDSAHNASLDVTTEEIALLGAQNNESPGTDDRGMSRTSSRPSSRVPKLSSRAAFTRTPSHKIAAEEASVQEGGILITEVQVSDDDREEDADKSESEEEEEDEEEEGEERDVSPSPPAPVVEVRVSDREEDYDTDLECEFDEEEDVLISYYRSCCEQLGLVPVDYFLRHMRNTNIRMRYRGLGSDATRAIALSLKDSITLEKLDMGGNWIGPEGARFMGRLLEENDYLTEVSLSDNKIGSEGGIFLANMMAVNGGLRRLDLAGNEFEDKCAEEFSLAIEKNKYLRELNLGHNKFTERGADFLGPAIGANENLEVLDLSWNHLREKGGIAVAKGIKENVRLKVCNLSWNGLDLRGGLAVADALTVNQSLLEIDLAGNRLTLEVATKLAKVITTNDTIQVLRMGNNLITSGGAIALASSVNNTEQCELMELDLTDVPVEYEFLRTLEDIKSSRPNFRYRHGPVMRAGNTLDDISKPAIDVDVIKKEPVVILKEHIVVNDLRLLDILKRYDTESSLSVTADDFVTALEELAVPYDKKRLQDSVTKFAATATGKIYFGSFVSDSYEKKKVMESAPS